jgi:hypothetical protein
LVLLSSQRVHLLLLSFGSVAFAMGSARMASFAAGAAAPPEVQKKPRKIQFLKFEVGSTVLHTRGVWLTGAAPARGPSDESGPFR